MMIQRSSEKAAGHATDGATQREPATPHWPAQRGAERERAACEPSWELCNELLNSRAG
ncbi:hypothetical protein KI387_041825, partial [Taxus chinensis]